MTTPQKPSPQENGSSDAYLGSVDPPSQGQLRELLGVLTDVRNGNFAVRVPGHWDGLLGRIGDVVNDVISANERMAEQLGHVGQVVGREGKTRQRVKFAGQSGSWAEMEESVNTLIEDLVWPTTEVTRVIGAVAQGDLLQTVRLDVDGRPLKGEFLRAAISPRRSPSMSAARSCS